MKNEIKCGKNIVFIFCALIYIEKFTFLDHKEIVHTHDGIAFCYRKYGAKYLAECETGCVRSKNLTLPISWDFPVWGTRNRYHLKAIKITNTTFFARIDFLKMCT